MECSEGNCTLIDLVANLATLVFEYPHIALPILGVLIFVIARHNR